MIFLDLETFSLREELLRKNTYAYAEESEILLFAYAKDNEPVTVVDLTNRHTLPTFSKNEILVAHNAIFDRAVLRANNWQNATSNRWLCTQALALLHSLAPKLSDLCDIYNLDEDKSKIKEGDRLIQLFCKPLGKNRKLDRATRETHPKEWERFIKYSHNDVEAMRTLYNRIPKWNRTPELWQQWWLNVIINDRGFKTDKNLCNIALNEINEAKEEINNRLKKLTNGEVKSTNQTEVLKAHLALEHGVFTTSLDRKHIEDLLASEELDSTAREILDCKKGIPTSVTTKYKIMRDYTCQDGRLRGQFRFCGAERTGRDSGNGVQPHNFPRPTLKEDSDTLRNALLEDCSWLYNKKDLLSSILRFAIIAGKNKKLLISDLSAIEARMFAWLTNDLIKLKVYKDYDKGIGYDVYKLTYAKTFGIKPETATSSQRQLGKVLELSLQYGGGVAAFKQFADSYSLSLDSLVDLVVIPNDIYSESVEWYKKVEERQITLGLKKGAYIVCDGLKRMWRRATPKAVEFWEELQTGFMIAMQGGQYTVGSLQFSGIPGKWVRLRLPSGRFLCYPSPKFAGKSITYLGRDSITKKWKRLVLHGGKISGHVTQGSSRDLFYENMVKVEKEIGYPIIYAVHDEAVCEVPDTKAFTHEELSAVLGSTPQWCQGLPVKSEGFESYYYKKG